MRNYATLGMGVARAAMVVVLLFTIAGCSGEQSALDPAGEEANQVSNLFWVMAAAGLFIWILVVALLLYATLWKRTPISEKAAASLPFWAGVVFPVTVLTGLLTYALWLMPSLRPFGGAQQTDLRIEVVGNQFWWHVKYHRLDRATVISANEIRLPVGERVEFSLSSADMIHSFWIPALGGKMDLIPGRVNRLSLLATRTGTYRGQCAEFCGTGHALMAFPVIVMEQSDFDAWIDARSQPSTGLAQVDSATDLFQQQGCGGCHRVDGTDAQGVSGPDLSHVGSRLTIGAGLFENDVQNLARFIAHSPFLKPGSKMPAYPRLSEADLTKIAVWLKGLQ